MTTLTAILALLFWPLAFGAVLVAFAITRITKG